MEQIPTELDGPVLIKPKVFGDPRGLFVETYRENVLAEQFGIDDAFVQDNHSRSVRGVVRGLHFQLDPPVAKLVRCARGAIFDVLVDIRPESPTFGRWEGQRLDEEDMLLLYVPAGFAHGFCVVSDVADVIYKQTAYWSPDADRGIALDDPEIGVEWPIPPEERIVSERDRSAPALADITAQLARS
jgi:dTDP-4-dehydrorhamnose 3,5-epimerase